MAALPVLGAALQWAAKPQKISVPAAVSSEPFDPFKLKVWGPYELYGEMKAQGQARWAVHRRGGEVVLGALASNASWRHFATVRCGQGSKQVPLCGSSS